MGLDMYLHKEEGQKGLQQVMYWRKSNAIHQWFDTHLESVEYCIENCESYAVTNEELEALRSDCQKVLKYRDIDDYQNEMGHATLREKVMPTQAGFFFGDLEYGDWYYEDLGITINFIDEYLSDPVESVKGELLYSIWY